MNKIPLEIVILTQSLAQNQSYTVVLGEVKGKRRLPIVIGNSEAQAIAMAIENMTPPRPLTHDLLKNILDTFEVYLKEVMIHQLMDGIFYSRLVCVRDQDEVNIDARTSDAIALAVRYGCPIYVSPSILESAGIYLDEEMADAFREEEEGFGMEDEEPSASDYSIYTLKELDAMLDDALTSEDYEKAASVRDEMQRRQKNR